MRKRQIEVTLYDKDRGYVGSVGDYVSCEVVERFNAPGQATLVLPSTHKYIVDLLAGGARARFDAPGMSLSGPMESFEMEGPSNRGLATFTFGDDFSLLKDFVCWVIPANDITAQGAAGVHDERTGPVETLIKAYTLDNAVTRLGMPISIATDQGRGPTVTLKMRFYTLYDKLFPVVDAEGVENGTLGFRILQEGTSLVLDAYDTSTYPHPLSETSGTLASWRMTYSSPQATDVVIGGQGEGQLRLLRTVTDAARITEHGRRIERWRDARDTDDPNIMYKRGNETLEEGRAKAGIAITFAESAGLTYGTADAPKVGDRISIELANGVTLGPEILREVTISDTAREGYKVTPKVGDKAEEPALVRTVRDVVRYLRRVNP